MIHHTCISFCILQLHTISKINDQQQINANSRSSLVLSALEDPISSIVVLYEYSVDL